MIRRSLSKRFEPKMVHLSKDSFEFPFPLRDYNHPHIGVGTFFLVPRPINNNASTAPYSPPFLKHSNALIHLVSTNNANIPIPTQSINQSTNHFIHVLCRSRCFLLCVFIVPIALFRKKKKKHTSFPYLILNPAYDIVRFHLLLDFFSSGSFSLSFTFGIFWHLCWVPLAVYYIRFPLWVFFLLPQQPFIVVVFLPNQYSSIRSIHRCADNTSHTESLI